MNTRAASPIEDAVKTGDAATTLQDVLFKDIGLKVGDRMVIEPPAKLGDQPGVVKLIGWVNDLSVLVTMPDTRPWAGPPIEGDTIGVRAFSGRHAYGFSTVVGKRSVRPFEYLHLEFPRRISMRQIRNAERIATSISARVMDADERNWPTRPAAGRSSSPRPRSYSMLLRNCDDSQKNFRSSTG